MDVEPTFVPFLTGFTYTKRRYTPEINTEADETVELDLTSKFGLLGVEEPKSSLIIDEFRCGIKGCKSTFTDVQAYEAHYNSAHKNVCQFCKKIYPTPFWLELHVLEHHDNYFKLLSTRQNMYQCLVESCKEKFLNEEKRKQHLIHVHAYPKSFDFQNLTARSIKRKPKKPSKANEAENSANKSPLPENKTKPIKRPRNPFNKMDIEDDNNDANLKTEATDLTTHSSEPMITEQFKDNNNMKESNDGGGTSGKPSASTRGNKQRNINQRGRGGRNNKRHAASDTKNDGITTNASEENSMQVESGSQQQVVFKGSVPKTFHFGRGRGRGMLGKPTQQNNTRRSDKDTNTNDTGDVQMNS